MRNRQQCKYFLRSRALVYLSLLLKLVQMRIPSSFCLSLCLSLQRWSHSHQCRCLKRFCSACWSIQMSSRSWNMMKRTSGHQNTTSSTGTNLWIISSSFFRCATSFRCKEKDTILFYVSFISEKVAATFIYSHQMCRGGATASIVCVVSLMTDENSSKRPVTDFSVPVVEL